VDNMYAVSEKRDQLQFVCNCDKHCCRFWQAFS